MMPQVIDEIEEKKVPIPGVDVPDYTKSKLRVWYGWEKLTKVRKRPALVILFENSTHNYDRKMNHVKRLNPVCMRYQSNAEAEGAETFYREFVQFRLFLEHKAFKGDVEKLLQDNYVADKNHATPEEREEIRTQLRNAFRGFYK